MDERPTSPNNESHAAEQPELADDELALLGVVAAASVPLSTPPARLRDRILAGARGDRFAFILEGEGIWLPGAPSPVACKELLHDSRDRMATRLMRLVVGAALPPAPLAGTRALFIIEGGLTSGEETVESDDFLESAAESLEWRATRNTLLLELSESARSSFAFVVRRSKDARWITVFPGGRIRPLGGAHESGREILMLDMASGTTLAEHEHHGVEELYVLRGSCEVEGQVMKAGDYHRATSGSTHNPTRTREGGCVLLVALRHPSRTAA